MPLRVAAASAAMFGLAEALARPLAILFVGYDAMLVSMTAKAFFIYSFSFLFSGFSIFGSSFFTALNDGLVSALIAFMRTLLFQVLAVLTVPLLFGLDGIWMSVVVAEILAAAVTFLFMVGKRRKYGY